MFRGNSDSNSKVFQILKIRVTACSNRPTCKTEEEINQFVSHNSLFVMRNLLEYRPSEYGAKTIDHDVYEMNLPLDP